MAIFKGHLTSAGKFTVQDDVSGLEILLSYDADGNAIPAYIQLESSDGADNYMWWDDSDNLRVHTSAPTNSTKNSGGSVVTGASNAGANRTLSNLGTVAANADILPGADSTYDLGSSTPLYWAEGYFDKLLLDSGATITGSSGTFTFVGKIVIGSSGGAGNADFKWFGHTANKFIVFDESADDIIISDATGLILGGDESTADGLKMEFDGTSTINFSALTTNDVLTFGPGAGGANLDVIFKGATSTSDVFWDASADTLQILDDAILNIGGAAAGTMDGVKIFYNATAASLDIDAVVAQDAITFGSNTQTDLSIHGALYDINWDASEDELVFGDNTEVIWGAGKDLQVESDGTLVNMTFSATDGGIVLKAYAAQTVAALHIDGATSDWDGADDVGMLHISGDTALIHAGASLLQVVQSTAKPINSAQGFLARFVDTSPVATTTPAYAVEIDSTNNYGLHIVTGKATSENLVLDGLQAQTAAIAKIDGSTGTGWDGADNVGMLHLVSDSVHVHAGATMLYVANSAQSIASAKGTLARFLNTGTARADAVMVEIAAKDNTENALKVSAGMADLDGTVKIGGIALYDQTAQTLTGAGAVDITSAITWVVTTGTDALTLADGAEGQRKFIVMKTDGGAGTLTPTNLGNGTTITFDDVGDCADLIFTNAAWHMIGGTATLA